MTNMYFTPEADVNKGPYKSTDINSFGCLGIIGLNLPFVI